MYRKFVLISLVAIILGCTTACGGVEEAPPDATSSAGIVAQSVDSEVLAEYSDKIVSGDVVLEVMNTMSIEDNYDVVVNSFGESSEVKTGSDILYHSSVAVQDNGVVVLTFTEQLN